jgi:ABC-type transport system involved in cytochrome c biogenesis permease component
MLNEILVLFAILFVWLPVLSFAVGITLRYSNTGTQAVVFAPYFICIVVPTASLAFCGYDEDMPGLAGKIVNVAFVLPAVLALGPLYIAEEGLGAILEPYWGFDFSEVTL